MDDNLYIFAAAAAAVGGVLFLYIFRDYLTDAVYQSFRHWKIMLVVASCAAGVMGAGAFLNGVGDFSVLASVAYTNLSAPDNGDDSGVTTTIERCKAFVAAEQAHTPGYMPPSPPLHDKVLIGAVSYWDTCSQAFGMNYWKYDISINGQPGGPALCGAYRQSGPRSPVTDGWCSTVLAPGQKI